MTTAKMAQPTGGVKAGVVKKAGLSFVPPAKDQAFASLANKGCWGQLLDDPQFQGLDAFQDTVDQLEDVVERKAGYVSEKGKFVEVPGHKAVLGARSGKLFSFASDGYVPVQDREVARPMLEAARDYQLRPFGRVDGIGTGRTSGHILLANPDFTVRLLEDYADDVMVGIRWWNSATTDTSFGAELFGIRTVCVNYNLWGALLGEFRLTHRTKEAEMVKRYADLLKTALDSSQILSAIVAKARSLVVERIEVPDLLWGVGLRKTAVETIADGVEQYAPEVRTLGLNNWTLYNAATAYVTYRPRGGAHLHTTEDYARGLVDLLTVSQDKVMERGRDAKARYEAQHKAAKDKRLREAELREKVLAEAEVQGRRERAAARKVA